MALSVKLGHYVVCSRNDIRNNKKKLKYKYYFGHM